ncbi:MAG: polysaccharide deacetylase family protein [bacterium]|jgi:peptidoglycan/xylan/chitin deacetylase (PgdA/CDA1 family)
MRGKRRMVFFVLLIIAATAALPLTAASPSLGSRTLKEGMKGEDVRELQKSLSSLGYQPLAVDGRFGPQTKARVKEFQKDNAVPNTGVFAKLTLAALQKTLAAKAAAEKAAQQAAAEKAVTAAARQEGFYRVRRGDTLSSIAARLGLKISTLCTYNAISDPDVIYAGQLLMLTPGAAAAPAAEAAAAVAEPDAAAAEPAELPAGSPSPTPDKLLAFTFNDGPHPQYTTAIADALIRYGGKGTFFVVGKEAEAQPEIMNKLVQDGHAIGNHTYSHLDPAGAGEAEIETEIRKTDAIIQSFTPAPVRYFRTPGGVTNQHVNNVLARTGHSLVLWSNLGARDNNHPGPAVLAASVLGTAYDGAIIMLHDTNAQTAEALPDILAKLSAEGFRFVTLNELFQN